MKQGNRATNFNFSSEFFFRIKSSERQTGFSEQGNARLVSATLAY